jgi:hypothetical protein
MLHTDGNSSQMETSLKALVSSQLARITIAFCGVVLPLLGILVQALKSFGVILLPPKVALDLTQAGRFWVHPERDVRIYILTTCFIIISILSFPWHKLHSLKQTRKLHSVYWIVILSSFGIFIFLYPIATWDQITPIDCNNNSKFLIYTIISFIIYLLSAVLISRAVSINSTTNPVDAIHKPRKTCGPLFQWPHLNFKDFLIIFFLGVFIFIPNTESLAGRFFQIEELYHWNAYAVSAALAYVKGGVLYGSFIPQYGVGWPLLLALVHPFYSLSYDHVLSLAMLVAIAYFYSVYFFFRTLRFNRILCFSATFLAAAVLILPAGEPETKSIVWRWSGGIPMRSPLDMVFFSLLFRHLSNPRKSLASFLGAICGMNILFSIDAGLFLITTMAATWFFGILQTKDFRALWHALYSCATAVIVIIIGLLFATRGELFSESVLKNIVQSVTKPAGEALLPFAGLQVLWVCVFCFTITLLFYSIVLTLVSEKANRGSVEMLGWGLGIYGLQRMVYFMGRTTWSNLLVMVVPVMASVFVIAATLRYRNSKTPITTATQIGGVENWISAALLSSTALVITVSRDTKNYPAFWNGAARKELVMSGVSFPRQSEVGVSGLPDQYFPYVQSMLISAQRMRELRSRGMSVCVLDPCATTLYLLAGVSPYGNTFDELAAAGNSRREAFEFARQISEKGPDIFILNKAKFPWPRVLASEAWQICRDELFSNYRRTEEYGLFEIWHRNRAQNP